VYLPDVNVLIYAFRPESPDHHSYRHWLEQMINGDYAYAIAPFVLSSVIRITTNPRVYREPSFVEEVLDFADLLMEQPNCHVVQPGERHWEIFSRLCVKCGAAGNLIPDAWLAALAIEKGCELITTDLDHRRFTGLRQRHPLQDN
jgi:toxin-antitoxin system PIN domain toxin